MFALFASIGGAWAWYVWKNKAHSHRIHYLMGLLCLLKALTVMCQAGEYHYIERTGHADGWNIAYYIFTFLRGVLFFTVVVLIGTGWSYMVSGVQVKLKPALHHCSNTITAAYWHDVCIHCCMLGHPSWRHAVARLHSQVVQYAALHGQCHALIAVLAPSYPLHVLHIFVLSTA